MSTLVQRREFITLLGGAAAAAASPFTARAQNIMPVVGILRPVSVDDAPRVIGPVREGLKQAGYVEGHNVVLDSRFAENQYNALPVLAADLVRRKVAAILTPGSMPSALAAKAATSTIPIVFASGSDPVALGLVESFNRPGENVTGVNYFSTELAAKRLGLLHELLPSTAFIAVLTNPNNVASEGALREVQASASQLGRKIEVFPARNNREIDAAFASLVERKATALLVVNDAVLTSRRVQIVTLAARHTLPAIYTSREYAEAGGLMTYGTNILDAFRQTGVYAGRILKGEKPAEMPISRSTKFEFIINLQTARTFGIEIPASFLARADEVIE